MTPYIFVCFGKVKCAEWPCSSSSLRWAHHSAGGQASSEAPLPIPGKAWARFGAAMQGDLLSSS